MNDEERIIRRREGMDSFDKCVLPVDNITEIFCWAFPGKKALAFTLINRYYCDIIQRNFYGEFEMEERHLSLVDYILNTERGKRIGSFIYKISFQKCFLRKIDASFPMDRLISSLGNLVTFHFDSYFEGCFTSIDYSAWHAIARSKIESLEFAGILTNNKGMEFPSEIRLNNLKLLTRERKTSPDCYKLIESASKTLKILILHGSMDEEILVKIPAAIGKCVQLESLFSITPIDLNNLDTMPTLKSFGMPKSTKLWDKFAIKNPQITEMYIGRGGEGVDQILPYLPNLKEMFVHIYKMERNEAKRVLSGLKASKTLVSLEISIHDNDNSTGITDEDVIESLGRLLVTELTCYQVFFRKEFIQIFLTWPRLRFASFANGILFAAEENYALRGSHLRFGFQKLP